MTSLCKVVGSRGFSNHFRDTFGNLLLGGWSLGLGPFCITVASISHGPALDFGFVVFVLKGSSKNSASFGVPGFHERVLGRAPNWVGAGPRRLEGAVLLCTFC